MAIDPEREGGLDSTVSSRHTESGVFEQESGIDFHKESIANLKILSHVHSINLDRHPYSKSGQSPNSSVVNTSATNCSAKKKQPSKTWN